MARQINSRRAFFTASAQPDIGTSYDHKITGLPPSMQRKWICRSLTSFSDVPTLWVWLNFVSQVCVVKPAVIWLVYSFDNWVLQMSLSTILDLQNNVAVGHSCPWRYPTYSWTSSWPVRGTRIQRRRQQQSEASPRLIIRTVAESWALNLNRSLIE